MYYEVDLIPMGFMKNEPDSMTADESDWNNPDEPDAWNVLVTKHMDDDSGEIDMVYDMDFPPNAKQYAESNYHMMLMMVDWANYHSVPFGSVPNPHMGSAPPSK